MSKPPRRRRPSDPTAWSRWRGTAVALLAPVMLCAPAMAVADPYPERPVRIITPYAAGGGIDVVTRVVAQGMSQVWHQPVIVDDRPGAGATIGTGEAAKALPDGYTLLLGANPLGISPIVYPNLPYDARRDFKPIVLIATSPEVLVVNPALGVKSVVELAALAHERTLNFGSAGSGTLAHLAAEALNQRAGLNAVHIPYKGSNPALIDLIAKQIDYVFDSPTAILPHVRSGKLRALAIAAPQRSALLPDLPTLAEAGYAGLDFRIWVGLLAPARTPPDVIGRVQAAAIEALGSETLRRTLVGDGWEVAGGSTETFSRFLDVELARLGEAARAAGVRAE